MKAISIVLLFLCSGSYSQIIEQGPPTKAASGDRNFLGKTQDKFFVYVNWGDDHHIERYDTKALTLEFSKKFSLKNESIRKDLYKHRVFFTGSSFVVFGSYLFKEESRNVLYAKAFDIDGKEIEDWKEVGEIFARGITIEYNAETGNILVVTDHHDGEGDESFSLILFDGKLKELARKRVQLDYKEATARIWQVLLHRDGSVYMLNRLEDEEKTAKAKKQNIQEPNVFMLYRFSFQSEEREEYEMILDGILPWNSVMKIHVGDNITLAGLYMKSDNTGFRGTLHASVDAKTRRVKVTIHPFDDLFVKEIIGEKKFNKGEFLPATHSLNFFQVNSDGSCMLVAENSYYNMGSGTHGTSSTYTHENLIVARIEKDGSLKWHRNIPKKSYGWLSEPMSSTIVKDDGSLALLILDHKRSYRKGSRDNKVRQVVDFKKALTVLVNIDKDGAVSYKPLIDNRQQDILLLLSEYIQTAKDTLVIMTRGRKPGLLRVTF